MFRIPDLWVDSWSTLLGGSEGRREMDVSAVSEELAELEGQINDIFRALS